MAFAPRDVSGAQPVDRVVVDLMEKEKWKDDSADVYYIKMQVTTNQQKSTVIGFVVRDVASDFLPPLIVIGEGEKDANILAFADEEEYITIKEEKKNDVEEYINKVIEVAEKGKKKKVKRYAEIISKAYKNNKKKP